MSDIYSGISSLWIVKLGAFQKRVFVTEFVILLYYLLLFLSRLFKRFTKIFRLTTKILIAHKRYTQT